MISCLRSSRSAAALRAGTLVTVAVSTLAAAEGRSCAQGASTIEPGVSQVRAVEAERARAMADADLTTLARITSDDYVHIESTGQLRSKSEFLDGFRRGEYHFESFVVDDSHVSLYGDTAVVSGRYHTVIRSMRGTRPRKDARFTRVYVLRDGNWRNVAHQATEMRVTPEGRP